MKAWGVAEDIARVLMAEFSGQAYDPISELYLYVTLNPEGTRGEVLSLMESMISAVGLPPAPLDVLRFVFIELMLSEEIAQRKKIRSLF